MNGLLPLYDAAEMAALDGRSIEGLGLPGAVLMERAGLAAALELQRHHPEARRVLVVAGSGNNGGDGFVVARHLQAAGLAVEVLLVGRASRLGIDAQVNLEAAERLGIAVDRAPSPARLRAALRRAGVVVDALLGIGSTGAPRGDVLTAVDAIGRAGRPVVALDVPTGVDASTGVVAGAAVAAAQTVVFHGPKVGLVVMPGRRHAGAVIVADIGIPPQLEDPTRAALATADVLAEVPRRGAGSSKYTAGSVLVVGGAPGFAGAPLMAGRAALRAGAGVVWLAVPEPVAGEIGVASPEIMVRPLPGGLDQAERAGAVVLGPGLGREGAAIALARRLARRHPGPLLVDADGLFAMAGEPELVARRRTPAVLTPHEGELARLLGQEPSWVQANRLQAVREAARRSGAVVLLKGADTLVAAPGGERVVVAGNAAYGLATAGAGDVLSGVIGALLARGMKPLQAAVCGAVAHGRSGLAAQERRGPDGIIAGDVIDELPGVLAR